MPPFQFKQFNIVQNNTAMKVGTDGVLLGAWTRTTEGRILDIGTGTGLIAIMLAQRSRTALVDAIEVESKAYNQAAENISASNWKNRIEAHHTPIQNFEQTSQYDLIVSNPPFFAASTKAPNEDRNTARHTDTLSFDDLIASVIRLLNSDGIFSLILPINEAELFINLATRKKLFLNKKCTIKPNPTKLAKRVLMEFSFSEMEINSKELTIETATRHQYTKEYISLTKDFYLKF
jgi:tRNA1Val (adenine37-N6)-methyltransferase